MSSQDDKRHAAYFEYEALRKAMPQRSQGKASQIWKERDENAQKKGNCQTVYWVKAKPPQGMKISLTTKVDNEKWMTGATYKGEWLHNKHHGFGIKTWSNGNVYEGEFKEGMRDGHGTFWEKTKGAQPQQQQQQQGSTSSASSSATLNSTGSLSTSQTLGSTNKSLSGTASSISSTSAGTSFASASDKNNARKNLRKVYTGNWQRDQRHGLGVYFYPDGTRYEGNFADGLRHGKGTYFMANETVYVGDWVNDRQCGFGTLSSATGIYEGQFLNGKREGQGIQYFRSNEKIFDGEWADDIPRCGVFMASAEFFDSKDDDGGDGGDVELDLPDSLISSAETVESKSLSAVSGTRIRSMVTESYTAAQRRKAFRLHFRPIPALKLKHSDSILADEIAKVQRERRAARSLPFIELEKLFSEEGLADLRRIFAEAEADEVAGGGNGDGTVRPTQLTTMFRELGFSLSQADLAQLLADAGKNASNRVGFRDFVKLAHLVDASKSLQAQLLASSATKDTPYNETFEFRFTHGTGLAYEGDYDDQGNAEGRDGTGSSQKNGENSYNAYSGDDSTYHNGAPDYFHGAASNADVDDDDAEYD